MPNRVLALALLVSASLVACDSGGEADGPSREIERGDLDAAASDARSPSRDALDDMASTDTLVDSAPEDVDADSGPADAEQDTQTDSERDVDGGSVDDAMVDPGDVEDDVPICATASSTTAPSARPADIIWVVDNSLSMQEEVVAVSDGINAFASFIGASGVDYQVVMVAYDDPVVGDGWYHVCVPPPLADTAEGVCPEGLDVDGDRYLHVRVIVDSNQPLTRLLNEHSTYAGRLRADATTHLIVVTDDDSEITSSAFEARLAELSPRLGAPVVVHSVVATSNAELTDGWVDCETPGCPCGAAVGSTYLGLSDSTGGTVSSVCEPDWSPMFEAIAESVVEASSVPCSYVIPELDGPVGINFEEVNVYAVDGDSRELIPNVGSAEECGDAPGWYYDDPEDPLRLQLCAAACVEVTGDVEIEFGCDTVKR